MNYLIGVESKWWVMWRRTHQHFTLTPFIPILYIHFVFHEILFQ